jgi:preprotein translocase subunit Sec61beta
VFSLSSKKRKREEAPLPAVSAGILRFYGEKTASSLKLRPELIVVLAVILMLVVVLAGWLIKPVA